MAELELLDGSTGLDGRARVNHDAFFRSVSGHRYLTPNSVFDSKTVRSGVMTAVPCDHACE